MEGSFKNVRVIFSCDEADLLIAAFCGTSVFVWLVKKAAQFEAIHLLRLFQRSVMPESNTKTGDFHVVSGFSLKTTC